MKRALNVSNSDHLNFFRLYDGCLMDVAVLSWCKFFGSKKTEQLNWEKLFPPGAAEPRRRLMASWQDIEFNGLVTQMRNYRDTYVGHHDLDVNKRAKNHPHLDPLRLTGMALYREVYAALAEHGQAHNLPEPDQFDDAQLEKIEEHWKQIANICRGATQNFSNYTALD